MSPKLLALVLLLAVFLAFIGLNLDNSCDISLGFTVFTSVPVFLTVFASFIAGIIFTIPFALLSHKRKPKKEKENALPQTGEPRKKFWARKKAASEDAPIEKIPGDQTPHDTN